MSKIVKALLKDVGVDFGTEEPKHNTGNVAFPKEENEQQRIKQRKRQKKLLAEAKKKSRQISDIKSSETNHKIQSLLKNVGVNFSTKEPKIIIETKEEILEKIRLIEEKQAKQNLRIKKLAEKPKLKQIIFEEKIPQKDIAGSKTSKLLKEVGIDFAPRKIISEKIEKFEETVKEEIIKVETLVEEETVHQKTKEKPEKEEVKYGYTVKKEIIDIPDLDNIIDVLDGNYVVSRPDFSNEDMVSPATEKITDLKSKEPLIEILPLHQELDLFKKNIMEQVFRTTNAAVGNLSGAGSGEVRLEFLDDVDTSGRKDGDLLIYNSSTNKYTFSSIHNISQLSLEDSIDGNLLIDGTDASSTDAGNDFLLESGVNSGRDFEHSVLEELTSNIIPQAGDTYNLGSETKRFKNIYLSSATINLGGATISSDGSGTLSISADGAILPTGSMDADGFVLARTTAASEGGQMFKLVKLYTQSSGLSTAAAEFKFNGRKANTAVYTAAGHVFTLNNGDARSDAAVDLFQF